MLAGPGYQLERFFQQFPEKEAILLIITKTERRRVLDQLRKLLEATVDEHKNVSHVVRTINLMLVESLGTDSRYGRAIVPTGWRT